MTPNRNCTLALDLAVLELTLYAFAKVLDARRAPERRYSPDQPRVSAGSPDGGQWTGASGSHAGARRSASRKPIQTALAGRLEKVELLHMERTYFWMCNYRDILGRRYGFSLHLSKVCPETWVAPPADGY